MSCLLTQIPKINPSNSLLTPNASVDMSQVMTIILAGGNGTRLEPLTISRCKPAVCFGGKYRLIDSCQRWLLARWLYFVIDLFFTKL